MEALLIIAVAIVILLVVLLPKQSTSRPANTKQPKKQSTEQLRDRKRQITGQLAKLSRVSADIAGNIQATDSDLQRQKVIERKISELEKERDDINLQINSTTDKNIKFSQELGSLIQKHSKLTTLLMKENRFTEEHANTLILNKIESLKEQYKAKGFSEREALEKAGNDVYKLVE